MGGGLRTKVNVNLGISGDVADEAEEWRKVDVALELGAEAIMDLSNSGKTAAFRRALIERSPAMIGTVPMYDAIGIWKSRSSASKRPTSSMWCARMPRTAWTSSPSTPA